jgi:phage gp46-like protein
MFDLATRAQPDALAATLAAAVPFDLRLAPPAPPSAYPYTSLVNDTGGPLPGVDMLAIYALALEGTLATCVVLSLFTDARAGRDDTLPLNETDRRGWVGDEFMPALDAATAGDRWGSLLWLYYTGKTTPEVLEQARFAAADALAWLVTVGIASRVDVTTLWVGPRQDRLAVRPTIWEPDQVQPVYDVLWGTSIRRWATN